MLIYRLCILFFLLCSVTSCVHVPRERELSVANTQIVDDFTLTDHLGASHQLSYYSDHKAIVIVAQGNGCPIVRKSITDLNALQRRFSSKGVVFFMINANPQDDHAAIVQEAREFNIEIPILEDDSQLVSESLGLVRTAEVLVIEPRDWHIVYRGPMDDRFHYETQKEKAGHDYLADVLQDMVDGKTVRPFAVPAKGCLISFNGTSKKSVDYARDVAPVLIKSCLPCHSPGGVAPWTMDNYAKVNGWGRMIREVVRTRRMPPWQADGHYGNFSNDISLTPQQKRDLVHWVEQGSFQSGVNDPLAAAPRPQFKDWTLGRPDLEFSFEHEQTIPATGVVAYHIVQADKPIDQDLWIRAVDLRPGNRKAVHHCDVAVQLPEELSSKFGGKVNELSKRSGMTVDGVGQIIAGYAPGYDSVLVFPEGTGLFIPKGSRLNFWMHYITTGKEEKDATRLGFYLYRGKPTRVYSVVHLSNHEIHIPPGEKEYRISASHVFDRGVVIVSLTPHMHYRGKSMRLTAKYPDGTSEVLLSVPDFKFNWQRRYILQEPKAVPAGTTIIADGVYDNSAQNLDNPDPAKTVTFGSQSTDEMFSAFIGYTTANK